MRLLVTGGSGFLGGYVLAEAARRGHECVALARSSEAARQVAARGATPLDGDLDDGAAPLGLVLRRRALRRAGQPGVARFRTRPRDRRGCARRRTRPGRLRLHHRGHHRAPCPLQGGAARRRGDDPLVEPGVDDPAAHDDLRRTRRQEPVPAARAARPGQARSADLASSACAAGARRRLPATAACPRRGRGQRRC